MTTDTIPSDRAAALRPEQLRQFTGSEQWYPRALVRAQPIDREVDPFATVA